MVRESTNEDIKTEYKDRYKDLNPDFIFSAPAYNMRNTEINAVLALNQLRRLDKNNIKRSLNLRIFLANLDKKKYYTNFNQIGNSNYAFTLLMKSKDIELRDTIETMLKDEGIEFRRGMSGGGNQLMQPYLRKLFNREYINYPNANHVHHFGWYIGNYPDLKKKNILALCNFLNSV